MSSPTIDQPGTGPSSGLVKSPAALLAGLLLMVLTLGLYFTGFNLVAFPFLAALMVLSIALVIGSLGSMASQQDYAGGVFMLFLATIAITGSLKLNFQTTTGVGPGMMPRALGVMVAVMGIVLILQSFFVKGEGLDKWSLRGIVFVLGAALIFSWTIRPLGLLIAGPLAVIFAGFADRDTRPLEIIIYAVVLTVLCWLLFSLALRLPIPVWPTAMPWPISDYIKL
jgi:putative tricarboxylic transport membrane protein